MEDIKPTEQELREMEAAKAADPLAYLSALIPPVPASQHVAQQQQVPEFRHSSGKTVKQSRDRAQYVRQQKGHSFILHWVILGMFTCFIVPIYYSVSPNHYWHI